MNPTSQIVHAALSAHPGATRAELVRLTGLRPAQVRGALRYGRTTGMIDSEQVGRRWCNYLARTPAPRPADARARVLAVVRRGPTTRAELARALGLNRSTVQHATVELQAAGLIVIHAERRTHRLTAAQQAAK